jgi:hypothetical protein
VALGDAGVYSVTVTDAHGPATSEPMQMLVNDVLVPVPISAQPAYHSVGMGGRTTFVAAAVGNSLPVFQWDFNGAPRTATFNYPAITHLSATVTSTFIIPNVGPADAGIYFAEVQGAGRVATGAEILGFASAQRATGSGQLAGADLLHPNGNIFDQVLSTGAVAAITAGPGKVTRVSGAGTLSLALHVASAPAKPVKTRRRWLMRRATRASLWPARKKRPTSAFFWSAARPRLIPPALSTSSRQ